MACSSISEQAWQLSIETNTALMQKYNKVSSEFHVFLNDLVEQLKAQGKDPGGLPEWIYDLNNDDADVAKIVQAYKNMINSGVIEKTPWITESLEIAEALILLKEKTDG
jgi:hypothetical protein